MKKNGKELSEAVIKIYADIIENASDPSNWGMAKSFILMAKESRVDISNEEEMRKFIDVYNYNLTRKGQSISQFKSFFAKSLLLANSPYT